MENETIKDWCGVSEVRILWLVFATEWLFAGLYITAHQPDGLARHISWISVVMAVVGVYGAIRSDGIKDWSTAVRKHPFQFIGMAALIMVGVFLSLIVTHFLGAILG